MRPGSGFSPGASRKNQPWQHLGFSPVKLFWISWPLKTVRWQFVFEAYHFRKNTTAVATKLDRQGCWGSGNQVSWPSSKALAMSFQETANWDFRVIFSTSAGPLIVFYKLKAGCKKSRGHLSNPSHNQIIVDLTDLGCTFTFQDPEEMLFGLR